MSVAATYQPALDRSNSSSDVRASKLFLALAVILITLPYYLPIQKAWMSSLTEYHGAEVEADLEAGAESGQLPRQVGLAVLGLFGLAAAVWPGGNRVRVHGPLALLCIAYLVWCAASCLWAEEPNTTFRRVVGACCEAAAGFGIARRIAPRQLASIIIFTTLSWIGLGILAELSLGTFLSGVADYRFAGITHPNDSAAMCALLIMAAAYLSRPFRRSNWLLWSIAAFAALVLYLTKSRTAIASLILTFGAIWLLTAQRRKAVLVVLAGGWLAALIVVVAGSQLGDLTNNAVNLGRADSNVTSLTGRVPLWQLLLHHVGERPVTGHGYSSFWTPDRIARMADPEWGPIASAHSLYLEQILAIGLVGAILCISVLFLSMIGAVRLERLNPRSGYGLIAILLCFVLVSGLLETTFGITGYLSLFTLIGISFVAFHDRRERQPAPVKYRQPAAIGPWIRFGESTP